MLLVRQEQRVRQVLRALPEPKAIKATRAQLEQRDLRGLKAFRDLKAFRENKAFPALLEPLLCKPFTRPIRADRSLPLS